MRQAAFCYELQLHNVPSYGLQFIIQEFMCTCLSLGRGRVLSVVKEPLCVYETSTSASYVFLFIALLTDSSIV